MIQYIEISENNYVPAGYANSGYCFVEHKGFFTDPNSCNKIPVIDLRTNGSISLSMCKQPGIVPGVSYLSKCTVFEVSYMHGSQWVSLGKDEKGAFEIIIDHHWDIGNDRAVLKVS